jgi:hypothetical protein
MEACGGVGILAAGYALARRRKALAAASIDRSGKQEWRMPPLT